MRKYLLPSALILVLGLGIALAQTITKAIQLSQDATGAFGVDTNNNVYFPAHMLTIGPGTPALTVCGTTPAIVGTDTAGTVTGGTSNQVGCTITFSKAYAATPYCVVSVENPATSPLAFTMVPTALVIGGTNMGAAIAHYICSGSK